MTKEELNEYLREGSPVDASFEFGYAGEPHELEDSFHFRVTRTIDENSSAEEVAKQLWVDLDTILGNEDARVTFYKVTDLGGDTFFDGRFSSDISEENGEVLAVLNAKVALNEN